MGWVRAMSVSGCRFVTNGAMCTARRAVVHHAVWARSAPYGGDAYNSFAMATVRFAQNLRACTRASYEVTDVTSSVS